MRPLRKHKKTTLPLPVAMRCTQLLANGTHCERLATYVVERVDGSSFKVCGVDARKLREQSERYAEFFDTLRFTAIHKFDRRDV